VGHDVSPPLAWDEPPAATQSFALVCDDPDAPRGTWVHWVLYDLPAATRQLPENAGTVERPAVGGVHGTNDFGRLGYAGPCPPPGRPHRYFFRLYAVDTLLGLAPGATRAHLEAAMRDHVLARGELVGTFGR
jgi:hypothetical protein